MIFKLHSGVFYFFRHNEVRWEESSQFFSQWRSVLGQMCLGESGLHCERRRAWDPPLNSAPPSPRWPFLTSETGFLGLVIRRSRLKSTCRASCLRRDNSDSRRFYDYGGIFSRREKRKEVESSRGSVAGQDEVIPATWRWALLVSLRGSNTHAQTHTWTQTANNLLNDFGLCASVLIWTFKPGRHSGSLICVQSISPDLLLSSVLPPRRPEARHFQGEDAETAGACVSLQVRLSAAVDAAAQLEGKTQKLLSASAEPRGWSEGRRRRSLSLCLLFAAADERRWFYDTGGNVSPLACVCFQKLSEANGWEDSKLEFRWESGSFIFKKESVEKIKSRAKASSLLLVILLQLLFWSHFTNWPFFCVMACCLLWSVSNTSDCFPSWVQPAAQALKITPPISRSPTETAHSHKLCIILL